MAKLKKTLPTDLERFCLNHAGDWSEPLIEKLKKMLSECEPDATPRGAQKITALHFTNIPIEVVAWQIERGANVNAPYTYGTPLYVHAGKGHYDICKLLLDKGADISAMDYAGKTPLFAAADGGHVDVVKLLLENGADPDHRGNKVINEKNALLYMLSRMYPGDTGKADVADILIDAMGGKDKIPAEEWKQAQEYVRTKGEQFEFSKSGKKEEYRSKEEADWAEKYQARSESNMNKFYLIFAVEPPKQVIKHDGKSPIVLDSSLSVSEQHDALWEYLVPPRGVCDTVQGEVIRITGRIGDEVYRNGGANWDGEYRKMLAALKDYFAMGTPLSEEQMEEVSDASLGINKCKACGCEKAVGKLQEMAVMWVSINSNPIPLESAEYNR